jgi:hypothetical protein
MNRGLVVGGAIWLSVSLVHGGDAQDCTVGSLYLGGARSNALFVDYQTRQAVYTRTTQDPELLLRAMKQAPKAPNVEDCADRHSRTEKCIKINLLEGRIVLAFKRGGVGTAYTTSGIKYRIADIARGFGFGLGDLYWIEYRGGDPNNPAGVFVYSTTKGVRSLSMTDDANGKRSALGSTLALVAGPGLLSEECRTK